jgi:PAT family beta-lactamase induction signal transducer AmpG
MGGSGFVVDQAGYPAFFVYTSLLGVPALVLLYFVVRNSRSVAGAPRPA